MPETKDGRVLAEALKSNLEIWWDPIPPWAVTHLDPRDSGIRETVIQQLEVMSILLGSHPEIVESMTMEEVSEELWDLGISPKPRIELSELTDEGFPSAGLPPQTVSSGAPEFIGDDLAVRSGSLHRLFERLQGIEGVEYSWVDRICSNPKDLSQRFEGAHTPEEFFRKNDFTHSPDFCVDLELAEEYKGSIDPSQITIAALYPSGAVRSVSAEVSLLARKLRVKIQNYLVFPDPDADQPTEDIAPFWGPVTLFAIQC